MKGVIEEWGDGETGGSETPVDDLVRNWRDACGRDQSGPRRNVIDRTVEALDARHGARLLDQMIAAPANRLGPRFRVSTAMACGLSLLIMAANPLVGLGGLYLAIRGWPNVTIG